MADVRLEGITKKFGDVTAVNALDLTIKDGEFVVLLGPTGAGKTTTLRLVAGLEKPEKGCITIDGTDVTKAQPSERDVSFVFQQYSLYPHYTVFQNLAFPLKSPLQKWGKKEIEARVREVAEMLHIEQKLKNKATELSGGEMQRVAIGRALVRRPSVFLMDEPLSSLDAKLRAELRVELKRISMELGATILYVTHDQVEAMTMADRIGVMNEGRLEQIGSPRDIYLSPDNVYVAQRLSSPPINLVDPDLFDITVPDDTKSVGVRPEDITITQTGGIEGQAILVEHLGAETVAVLQVNGTRIQALVDPRTTVNEGQTVRVGVAENAPLFFDGDGRRIGERSGQKTGAPRNSAIDHPSQPPASPDSHP
jgi:multiple sugar transport system ATP-binding protein